MTNAFRCSVTVAIGNIALEFWLPLAEDRAKWDELASTKPVDLDAKVEELLFSLLKGASVDGKTPDDWQTQLKESLLLSGPNGVEVGRQLFLFRTVKAVVSGIE